jgi:hypothetical protein
MIWKLLAAASLIAFSIVFAWPWVSPWLERRDATGRLLDRLEEEWEREGDSLPKDWNW